MTLAESSIIASLRDAFSPAGDGSGIGDDAAVIPVSGHESLVITKDILVEDVHFRLRYGDAASLAHKALHVNLSDIAAMGARPESVLLGIALSRHVPEAWVKELLRSFTTVCQAAGVRLIGGDTTVSAHGLLISVTAIGRADNAAIKLRSGAKAGDVICVAGALGEARAGLALLEKDVAGHEIIKAKSLRPTALVAEGLWLGQQAGVTAMMDVSDGLYVDLGKLAQASGIGAVIEREVFCPSQSLSAACAALGTDAVDAMIAGGEDYALLFTVAPQAYEKLAADFAREFTAPLRRVGAVTKERGVELRAAGRAVEFTAPLFSHFGEL